MEQINHQARRDPFRFTYEDGLRRVFEPCRAPLPPEMQRLMERLQDSGDGSERSDER